MLVRLGVIVYSFVVCGHSRSFWGYWRKIHLKLQFSRLWGESVFSGVCMGKRYFCDYCDRSFQDNLHNRKKHLNGVQHLRAKKVWYDLFRDAAAVLQEEQSKKPCRKFLQTGQCDFGSNCRFSHMTEVDLEKLNAQVQDSLEIVESRKTSPRDSADGKQTPTKDKPSPLRKMVV